MDPVSSKLDSSFESKVNIGIIVSRKRLKPLEKEFMEWILTQPEFNLKKVIILREFNFLSLNSLKNFWQSLVLNVIYNFEKIIVGDKNLNLQSHFFKKRREKLDITFIRVRTKDWDSVTHPSANSVPKQLNLDFVLSIENRSNFDLISKYFGCQCIHTNLSYSTGFSEVISSEDQSYLGVYISEEHSKKVFCEGHYRTRPSYFQNREGLSRSGLNYLKKAVLMYSSSMKLSDVQSSTPLFTHQFSMLSLFVGYPKFIIRKIGRYFSFTSYINRIEPWNIGFSTRAIGQGIITEYFELGSEFGTFHADPFLFQWQGEDYCFVEKFEVSSGKGKIVVFRISDNQAKYLGDALVENFHLSYPFIFAYNGEIYMCPETSAINEIRLYKCVEFPSTWRFDRTLVSGIKAVDNSLFERDGIWWMLSNIDSSKSNDFSSELVIHYADSPISSNWVQHQQNPVVIDSFHGRNGGLLVEDEKIIRIGQRQTINRYGISFSLREITDLTPSTYREVEVMGSSKLLPGVAQTHHFHQNSNYFVFDFCE